MFQDKEPKQGDHVKSCGNFPVPTLRPGANNALNHPFLFFTGKAVSIPGLLGGKEQTLAGPELRSRRCKQIFVYVMYKVYVFPSEAALAFYNV